MMMGNGGGVHDEKTGADGEYSVTFDQRQGGSDHPWPGLMAVAGVLEGISSRAGTFDCDEKSGPKGVVQTADGRPGRTQATSGAGYLSLGKGTPNGSTSEDGR